MRARDIGALALLAVLATAGCREGQAVELPPLPGSAASLDSLGQGVVEGFIRGDTARLRGYVLSLDEYRDVWPRLQIDTTAGFGFDWSWRDNRLRGERAFRRYLAGFHEMSLTAVETRCTGEPHRFEGVTVLPGCTITVRDSTGATEEMRLFKSVVVIGGGHKIFRYDD